MAELPQQTILPGILVDQGAILMDETKLLYPGDLLHEAGYWAVIPAERRKQTQADVGNETADEMMAIAWSYAALVYLGLEPTIVFHADGYRGWVRDAYRKPHPGTVYGGAHAPMDRVDGR